MIVDQVNISAFRNFSNVQISVCPSVNLFVGANGSGKTSILESIYLFGFGRSFRTHKLNNVIEHNSDSFTLFLKAHSVGNINNDCRFGLSRDRSGQNILKLDGEVKSKLSEIARYFPIQLFTPQSSDVLLGSPNERRQFIDWGLFHVEHSFFNAATLYKRSLKQRNALLKLSSFDDVTDSYWRQQLAIYGEQIDNLRKDYVKALSGLVIKNCEQFLPEMTVELNYTSGWIKDQDLLMSLQNNIDRDRLRGYSSVGPHKGELKIKVNGYSASEVLSRGQLRVLMASMQLAQTQHLKEQQDRQSIFLLDDVGAELDATKRSTFIELLLNCDAQIFVTAIDKSQFNMPQNCTELKMFHVEHGTVTEEKTNV